MFETCHSYHSFVATPWFRVACFLSSDVKTFAVPIRWLFREGETASPYFVMRFPEQKRRMYFSPPAQLADNADGP